MRAMVMESIRGPLSVQSVPAPESPSAGVVIEVQATGLCGSDWHAWAGHEDIALPHVPGHELAGVIAAVGEGVREWSVGDRVTVPFVCGCGQCRWCLAGDAQVCPDQQQPGFTHWGSFAEYVPIHAADTNLVAVPEGVSAEAAAALGCRFATAYRALTARAGLERGQWLTVVGAGGLGLSLVMIARALGARVIAVDRSAQALSAAERLGAEHTILADGADVPAEVHRLTGEGSDVAVDAVGSAQTCADSVMSLRRRGRHVQIGLLPTESGLSPVPMARAIAWELDLLGSHGMAAADYPGMLELIRTGALQPEALIERVVGLEEAAELLPHASGGAAGGMTMIRPSSYLSLEALLYS